MDVLLSFNIASSIATLRIALALLLNVDLWKTRRIMFKRFRLTRRRSATPTRSSVSGLQKVSTTTNIKRTYTGRSPSPQIYKKYITNIYWKVTTTRCASVSSLSAIPCRRRPLVLATWRCSLSKVKNQKKTFHKVYSPPSRRAFSRTRWTTRIATSSFKFASRRRRMGSITGKS